MISRLRILALGLVAGLALAASGCGGTPTTGASSSSGASLVRADSLLFFTVDSDTSSSQWKQLDTLSKKFPGRDHVLKQIEQSLAGQGVDFQNDVKPALGPQVDFVVGSGGASPGKVTGVGLTKPNDPDKLKALVDKMNAQPDSGHPSVMRKLSDGWYALGDSQSAIDKVLKGSDKSLADESTYKDALSKLPSDALATAYVNGQQLGAAIHEELKSSPAGSLSGSTAGLDKLDFVAASLSAEDDGVRVHGAAQGQGAGAIGGSGDYSSKLLSDTPSDAFAFLSFRGGKSLGAGLGQLSVPLEFALGVSLQDVLALFQNENAFWVRPGAVIPEFTAILQPDDTSAGLATLNKLALKLAGGGGARVTGAAGKTISFGKQFQLHYGAVGSKIVLTSAPAGIKSVGSTSGNLADNADFKEAKSAAGMPSASGGFLYVDLKNAIPLIEGFASLSGNNLPSSTTDNLRPLRSFLTWSGGSGDSRTFDAFLEIK
jgi:hypothetical protein